MQAWITPPAYTGLAPVFLKNEGGAVSVPAASRLTVSVTGGSGEPSLSLAGTQRAFQALDGASFQADAELTTGGRLAVRRGGREIILSTSGRPWRPIEELKHRGSVKPRE